VHSPIIAEAEADVILAFEKMEALRHIKALKPGGMVVVNKQEIPPAPVSAGLMDYPEDIWDRIKAISDTAVMVDGDKLAKEAGTIRAVNIVLLGALSKYLPFSDELWLEAIKQRVPEKFIDMNMKAFHLGREAVS
jgi:indolepyruvate ferredoxin oxidoreductase beta subunit